MARHHHQKDSAFRGQEVLQIMGSRGKALSVDQVRRIVSLLASTELTVPEIAERMGCSRSTVVTVNRCHGVRHYQGHRNVWVSTAGNLGIDRKSSV
jgi:hypothetical protein